jgi:serine/threonine-protein kinase RsbW
VNEPLPRAEDSDTVELRIPCKAEWVALARLAVAVVANRLQFSIDEIEDVKLAVAEACTTAIQRSSEGSAIEITCEALPEGLRITVRSGARSVNHQVERHDLDDERVGGLGIFLIRSLMDEVAYDTHAEHGTQLVMLKRLPA